MVACTRRQPKADALQTALAMGAPTSASISAVPDLQQEIAVGGPLLERVARRAKLLLIRLLRIPYHLMLLPFSQLRGEIASLRAAAVESLAYVGVELRRIGDLVERGASESTPTPEETTLAQLDVHGPLLVVGRRGEQISASLTSRGYDVTHVDDLEGWDAGGRRFGAVLYMGDTSEPNAVELERISELISNDGALVMRAVGGPGGNGSGNGFDEGSLAELGGWAVAERIVVARRTGSSD